MKNPGIKFNIPLDQRVPGFNFRGDSEKSNVAHMWDINFWREYLDELARNRFNVLSIWAKHPFATMVKLPDYPDTEVHDVIDGYGTFVKNMSLDEEIAFWKEVLEYAGVSDILSHLEEIDGPFEFFFKNAKAHIHSTPDIKFADPLLNELPDGIKCWWTLRNDDLFYLRWGDPEFVRDFIGNFDKVKTAGYLMGSDGYV